MADSASELKSVRNRIGVAWKRSPKWLRCVLLFLVTLLGYEGVKTAFNNVFTPEKLYEPIFKVVKNAVIEGSRALVRQIPDDTFFDFQEGTLVIWVPGPSIASGTPMQMEIRSIHDPSTKLTFEKDKADHAKFRLDFPTIGTVERSVQVDSTDLAVKDVPFMGVGEVVFLAFSWNLEKIESNIYVNGESRSGKKASPP